MRVNIYAEEMTPKVSLVKKEAEGTEFTGIRFWLELPATVNGEQYQGPFIHKPGDDSSAVTFWGKRKLRAALVEAIILLDKAEADAAADYPPVELTATCGICVTPLSFEAGERVSTCGHSHRRPQPKWWEAARAAMDLQSSTGSTPGPGPGAEKIHGVGDRFRSLADYNPNDELRDQKAQELAAMDQQYKLHEEIVKKTEKLKRAMAEGNGKLPTALRATCDLPEDAAVEGPYITAQGARATRPDR